MTENEYFETVEAVCENPRRYTPTGTFYEAVSFLEGNKMCSGVGKRNYHMPFTPFRKWIVKKFKIQKSIPIIDWVEFREMFLSDSEAFNNLKSLYKEFANSSIKQKQEA